MASTVITQQDVDSAGAFIQAVVSEAFPDADYTKGSVLHDHVVGALATMIAVMRGEAKKISNARSLLTAFSLTDADERLEAVRAIASGWFVSPKPGNRVRGTVTLHFSQPHTGAVPLSARMTKITGIRYIYDGDTAYTYDETSFTPVVSADGSIVDYALRIPVIAEFIGSEFGQPEGLFSFADGLSAYFIYAENEQAFAAATDPETAEELALRIPDAISVRDLNSARSIRTVVADGIPEVNRVVVQGMSATGMSRDLVSVSPTFANIHVGGKIDVLASTPIVEEQVFEATVGGAFQDESPFITLFRDPTVEDFRVFCDPGDVIRIHNARATEPRLYIIETVAQDYLAVYARQPFPAVGPSALRDGVAFDAATITAPNLLQSINADFAEEDVGRYVRVTASSAGNAGDYKILSVDIATNTVTLDTGALVSEAPPNFEFEMWDGIVAYSVGNLSPAYENKIAYRTTGQFTKQLSAKGQILLPNVPVYLIRSVEVLDAADTDANPITGRVEFPLRVNRTPVAASGSALEYQVVIDDPLLGYSDRQRARLIVGYAPSDSGVDGVLSALGTFTSATASFSVDDVGKTVFLSGATYAVNRGAYTITARASSTSVTLAHPSDPLWVPTPEARLVWNKNHTDKYDGKIIRVTYDTVSAFSGITSIVQNEQNRVVCADTLVKAPAPVYVTLNLRYSYKNGVNIFLNETEAKAALADFITNFPTDDILNASDIVTFFQSTNEEVGSVRMPIDVDYTLFAPDGRRIPYSTQDVVSIAVNKSSAVVPDEILTDPESIGVTETTVRYLSTPDLITLTEV